jgi:3D-(3,5/4)-trihydroxycyclohexane-1,2-dione acylhydrolase (decyclizing)
VRLTVGQAVVRFLDAQRTSRDGVTRRLIEGCFGIFGHGNVAGLGAALLEAELAGSGPRYVQARNEQAMVHAAAAFARVRCRMSTMACTSSIGPGATNMVTGAALATISRLPVLLLPGDVFATRVADPVLQQLEFPGAGDVSVNDAFRPVSAYFDRVWRPEQLPSALLAAMAVLTDPARTGAVTLALPQDVQAQAFDWPASLFDERVWHVRRTPPDPAAVSRAVSVLGAARRPLIVAGGGVLYSEAVAELRSFAEEFDIPVAVTQAGKGVMRSDHPLCLGAIGATGTPAANEAAASADVVIGAGTRWTDFTTASRSIFAAPDVRFVNLNVAAADAVKLAGVDLVADARAGLQALAAALRPAPPFRRAPAPFRRAPAPFRRAPAPFRRAPAPFRRGRWRQRPPLSGPMPPPTAPPERADGPSAPSEAGPVTQIDVIAAVNEACGERGIMVCAAGSLPGDLHKLWHSRDPLGYHVEYGYSCMGYEIAGGLGVKLAAPDREVFVLVGDGSYLMMNTELVTAVQEGIKLIVVLVDNHGFASIGNLSESVGAQRFGTSYRFRAQAGRLDGGYLPLDLAANAASLGADATRVQTADDLRMALDKAKESQHTTVIVVETDPNAPGPAGGAWWDVPVAEVSELDSVREARRDYERGKTHQRPYV